MLVFPGKSRAKKCSTTFPFAPKTNNKTQKKLVNGALLRTAKE